MAAPSQERVASVIKGKEDESSSILIINVISQKIIQVDKPSAYYRD